MSVAVDVARDGVRIPISEARVREVVREVCRREKVRDALISVAFVGNRSIARMNRDYLHHSGATDVITFELPVTGGAIVGDIYIAPDVARNNATENGIGVREEIVRLIVHGTLHVLGYTHPEDDGRTSGEMWRRQERLVAALV